MSLTTGDIALLHAQAKKGRHDPVTFIAQRLCISENDADALIKQARNCGAIRSEARRGR